MQLAHRAVEPRTGGLLRCQPVERVGARIDGVEVLALERDRDEDVPHVYRIALHGIDANQMIAELREHGLAEHAGAETAQRRGEGRDESRVVALDPSEISSTRGAPRVRRLPLGRVFKLGFAAGDFGPQGVDVRPRSRAIGTVGDARNHEIAEPGGRGALELTLMSRVVALQLRLRHGCQGVRDVLGSDREQRDGDRFVLVAPDTPQLRVREVNVRRQIVLQLALGQILPVELLDLRLEFRSCGGEVALPLGDIEPAVGLEGRVLHHLIQNLWRG